MTAGSAHVGAMREPLRLGLFGYGEVAHALALGLSRAGLGSIAAYQRRPLSALALERARQSDVWLVDAPADLAASCDVVIALTQGGEALRAAQSIACALTPAHCYADLSSASPSTKQAIATLLAPTGASFVDGVIEASPLERGHALPVLLSGPGAKRFDALLRPWGLQTRCVGEAAGDASLIKALRNLLVKGQMALLIEAMTAARQVGVEEELFASVAGWYDALPFAENATRVLRTTPIHAARRAEEAQAARAILHELGLDPVMAQATSQVLGRVAALDLRSALGGVAPATLEEALQCMAPAVGRAG
ncbi:MAG TPA: DUF1932 domain-containing protein [Ramlibacter sp.]|nr:DUF1932 domain-containing protein [Ramlibacter sp.]